MMVANGLLLVPGFVSAPLVATNQVVAEDDDTWDRKSSAIKASEPAARPQARLMDGSPVIIQKAYQSTPALGYRQCWRGGTRCKQSCRRDEAKSCGCDNGPERFN